MSDETTPGETVAAPAQDRSRPAPRPPGKAVPPAAAPQPRERATRPRRLTRALLALVALAASGLAIYRFVRPGKGTGSAPAAEAAGPGAGVHGGPGHVPAVRVTTARPTQGGMARSITLNGSVAPFEFSPLYAKVSGYLGTLNVDIGDRVKEGQELAVIDVPELDKAVDQARAKVDDMTAQKKQAEARLKSSRAGVRSARSAVVKARAEVERTKAQREYRKKALDRIQELAARNSVERKLLDEEEDRYQVSLADEQAAAAGVLDAEARQAEAEAKVELAQADVEDAAANIRVAEADLEQARVLAGYTHIRSPYTGVITQRGFHRGDFVRSAADGVGQPILTVARDDLMRVIVLVPEREIPYLNDGDPATLRVDALGDRIFRGSISRTARGEDTRDRTMRAEVDMPNPEGALVGGMYGYVTLEMEPPGKGLSIPSSSLVEHGGDGEAAVFVVEDGKARRREVRIGRDDGEAVEILGGLGPDDRVIDRGVGTLADGTPVRLEEPGGGGAKAGAGGGGASAGEGPSTSAGPRPIIPERRSDDSGVPGDERRP